jgi:hypothetical protein
MPSKSKSDKIAKSLDLEFMTVSEDYDVEPTSEPEPIEEPQVEESVIEEPQVEETPKSIRGMCEAKLASTGEKIGYVSLSDPRWKTREIVHARKN